MGASFRRVSCEWPMTSESWQTHSFPRRRPPPPLCLLGQPLAASDFFCQDAAPVSARERSVMHRKIHVANLSHMVQRKELEGLFAVHGMVRSAEVTDRLRDRQHNQHRAGRNGLGRGRRGRDRCTERHAASRLCDGRRVGRDGVRPRPAPPVHVRIDEHPRRGRRP